MESLANDSSHMKLATEGSCVVVHLSNQQQLAKILTKVSGRAEAFQASGRMQVWLQ